MPTSSDTIAKILLEFGVKGETSTGKALDRLGNKITAFGQSGLQINVVSQQLDRTMRFLGRDILRLGKIISMMADEAQSKFNQMRDISFSFGDATDQMRENMEIFWEEAGEGAAPFMDILADIQGRFLDLAERVPGLSGLVGVFITLGKYILPLIGQIAMFAGSFGLLRYGLFQLIKESGGVKKAFWAYLRGPMIKIGATVEMTMDEFAQFKESFRAVSQSASEFGKKINEAGGNADVMFKVISRGLVSQTDLAEQSERFTKANIFGEAKRMGGGLRAGSMEAKRLVTLLDDPTIANPFKGIDRNAETTIRQLMRLTEIADENGINLRTYFDILASSSGSADAFNASLDKEYRNFVRLTPQIKKSLSMLKKESDLKKRPPLSLPFTKKVFSLDKVWEKMRLRKIKQSRLQIVFDKLRGKDLKKQVVGIKQVTTATEDQQAAGGVGAGKAVGDIGKKVEDTSKGLKEAEGQVSSATGQIDKDVKEMGSTIDQTTKKTQGLLGKLSNYFFGAADDIVSGTKQALVGFDQMGGGILGLFGSIRTGGTGAMSALGMASSGAITMLRGVALAIRGILKASGPLIIAFIVMEVLMNVLEETGLLDMFEELMDVIGSMISTAVQPLVNILEPLISAFEDWIEKMQIGEKIAAVLQIVINAVWSVLKPVVNIFMMFAKWVKAVTGAFYPLIAILFPLIGLFGLLGDMMDDMGEDADDSSDDTVNVFDKLFKAISDAFTGFVSGFLSGIVDMGNTVIQAVMQFIVGPVIQGFQVMWQDIVNVASTIWDAIKGPLSQFGSMIVGFFMNDVVAPIGQVWNSLGSMLSDLGTAIWNAVVGGITDFGNKILGFFKGIVDAIVKFFMGSGIPDRLADLGSAIWNMVSGSISKFGDLVTNAFRGIVSGIVGAFSGIGSAISNALSSASKTVTNIASTAAGAASSAVSTVTSAVSSTASMANQAISSVVDQAQQLPVIGGAIGAAGGALKSIGSFFGFQKGGMVPGMGMGDKIPAFLTPGEMVLPAQLTSQLMSFMKGMGAGQAVGFQYGGMVPGAAAGAPGLAPSFGGAGGLSVGPITVQATITSPMDLDRLANDLVNKISFKIQERNRRFSV